MKIRRTILASLTAAGLLLNCFFGFLPAAAQAASSSEIKKQIEAVEEEKAALKKQITQVQSQYEENENDLLDLIARKNVLDQEIGLLSTQITKTNTQITYYSTLIADKQDELTAARERLEELNEAYKGRIRTVEENGEISYWEVVFKANSLFDLLDRLNIVSEIAASDQRRLQELREAAQEVETAQLALEQEKQDLEQTKRELDESQAELDAKKEASNELLQQLLSRADELEAMREDLESQEAAFLEEIAALEKAYTAVKEAEWQAYLATMTVATTQPTTGSDSTGSSGSGGSSGTGSGGSGSGTVSTGASWIVPCSYTYLSSPFGYRESPTTGASTYHQGVDLAAPAGTPIYASRGGTVTVASYSSSAGYYVSINHLDGFSSIYMHMTNYVVSSGQSVAQGQLIGYVGSTGISTGNHLHFGISYNGVYVNPCQYVNLG